MWKYMSRRIRDTFEKSVNQFDKRNAVGLTNSKNFSDEDTNRASPPCRWYAPHKCWKAYHDDKNTNSNRWNFEQLYCSWIGAITWSSALVVGWYVSQVIHLKHKYCLKENENSKKCKTFHSLTSALYPYVTSVNKNAIYSNSVSKIEKAINAFIPTVHLVTNEQEGSSESPNSKSSTNTDNTNDLNNVLNSIENRLGLAAIENGQHKEGLNLLRSAANRNHAPALYNLGLCYEMGLGVPVDEKMAMELYRSAAALEHPGALYNLGIYYGQGRGGLAPDDETAIRLLRLAASQGQRDAIHALKSLSIDEDTPNPPLNDLDSWKYQSLDMVTPCTQNHTVVPIHSSLFVGNVNSLQQKCEATVY